MKYYCDGFTRGTQKKYGGGLRITDEMYDSFSREYKEKQADLLDQMQDHSDADEQFYITANMTMGIAKRAKEIFISSEVDEKRQFLGFLLQNSVLNGKKLDFTIRSPFSLLLNHNDNLTVREWLDAFRTVNWKSIQQEMQYFHINQFSQFATV